MIALICPPCLRLTCLNLMRQTPRHVPYAAFSSGRSEKPLSPFRGAPEQPLQATPVARRFVRIEQSPSWSEDHPKGHDSSSDTEPPLSGSSFWCGRFP